MGSSVSQLIDEAKRSGGEIWVEENKIAKSGKLLKRIGEELPNLQKLRANGCKIKELPEEINGLTSLKSLSLQRNKLTSLGNVKLNNLVEIYLSYNRFTHFPNTLLDLKNLTILVFSHNNLHSLDHVDLKQLVNLKVLDISYNSLSSFPPCIFEIASLTSLNMERNELISLPPKIGSLNGLKELILKSNKLTQLPDEIGKMISLTKLDVSRNSISSLSEEFFKARTLQVLYLQHNLLNTLPPSIKHLKKLVDLRLNGNKFIRLPEELGKLYQLKELFLQENELMEIPKKIGSLHMLKKLRLEFNLLQSLPQELSGLSLEILYLHNNQFKLIPEILRNSDFTKRFINFSLDNNPLDESTLKRLKARGSLNFLREIRSTSNKDETDDRIKRLSTNLSSSQFNFSDSLTEDSKDKKKRSSLSGNRSGTFSRNSFNRLKKAGTEATKRLTMSHRNSTREENLVLKRKNSNVSEVIGNQNPEEEDEVPPFENFKQAFDMLLESEEFTDYQQDHLNRASPQEKWQFLSIYNGANIRKLLKSNTEDIVPAQTSAVQYAQFLREKHHPKMLHKICVDLRVFLVLEAGTQPMWVYQFMKQGGIEALLEVIQSVNSKTEKLTEDEISIEYECIRCLRLLANIDIFSLLVVRNSLDIITLSLNSKNTSTVQVVIGLLETITLYGPVGHAKVLDALKYFDETTRNRSTCVLMEPFYEDNLELKTSCLSLINGLIIQTQNIEERFELRNKFIIQGLIPVTEELNRLVQKNHLPLLVSQLHIFDEELANDTVSMVMEAKKKNKKRNSAEVPKGRISPLPQVELKLKSESFGNFDQGGNHINLSFSKHDPQTFPFNENTFAGDMILKIANCYPYVSPDLHNHSIHILSMTYKTEKGIKKTISLDLWLEEDERFGDYNLQGEVEGKFEQTPNLLRVQILDSIKKVQYDPNVTSGTMVETLLQCMNQMNHPKDDLEGEWRIVTPDGIWMDPTKSMSEYRIRRKAIYTLKKKSKPRSLSANTGGAGATDGDVKLNVNIWNEPSGPNYIILHPEKTEISAASLNKLVQELTSEESYEPDFLNAFLYTYHSFSNPEELFNKLIERYHVPSHVPDNKKRIVQLRVCLFMKYWIEKAPYDIGPIMPRMEAFFDQEMAKGGYSEMIPGVKKALLQLRGEETHTQTPGSPKAKKSKFNFMELNDQEFAQQLTLIHFEIYKQIRPSEFFNLAWTKSTANKNSPNLLALVNHFNTISNWVVASLLFEEKLKDRAAMMNKFINLAMELRKHNNFSLMTSIISAFNNSAIARLKWTKSKLSKSSKSRLEALEKEMEFDNSYKNYRTAIENTSLPAIPYIGVCLGDLTFIEQGNQDFIQNGLIHWDKCKLIYGVIEKILFLQKVNYSFEPNREMQRWIKSFDMVDEEELVRRSLHLEPKDATKNEIK